MNEIKIFENEKFFELKDLEQASPYTGFVYIVEFGDKTKIGCTTNPSRRIGQLKAVAAYGGFGLGRIALTPGHTNYRETELLLHHYFAKDRIEGTELFNLGFDEILASLPELPLKDESLRLHDEASAFLEFLKDTVLGTNDSDNVRCPVCNKICDTIYMDKNGKVFACDNCVIDQDSYTWNFEKRNNGKYAKQVEQ